MLYASLRYYWPTHLMVLVGVTVSVAVLAGALLVGHSVRASLADLAVGRLGRTDLVVSSTTVVKDDLAERFSAAVNPGSASSSASPQSAPSAPSAAGRGSAPSASSAASAGSASSAAAAIFAAQAELVHERSGRSAARVQVFGIDDRFADFQGLEGWGLSGRQAFISPGLAAELGGAVGDSVLLRIAKPTDIPLGTLQGRRDAGGERIRLEIARVLDADSLGEFSLVPSQGPTLSIFVPLERLQRDLDLEGRVNTLLVRRQVPLGTDGHDELAAARSVLGPLVDLDDLGLRLRETKDGRTVIFESRSGLLAPDIVEAGLNAGRALGVEPVPVLSYLANTISANGREIPYSLVVAMDDRALGAGSTSNAPAKTREGLGSAQAASATSPIWLNAWAADDLKVTIGQPVTLTYYVWSDEDGLSTHEARFTFAGTVPMEGAGGDPTFTPEYPGITDVDDVSSWDPPFPVDLARVRPIDERYWDDWRTAPKALVGLSSGQALWSSPFGSVSSLRFTPEGAPDAAFRDALAASLRQHIDPFTTALAVRDARAEALAAAEGTTDFGEYFLYFSFFLVCAALILTYLFFTLNLEQRTRELGLLSAVGFSPRDLRRHFLGEGVLLAGLGAIFGVAGAAAYAQLILYGLRTWWVDAVGTRALALHVDPFVIAAGVVAAWVAALAAIWMGIRRFERRSVRTLLTGAGATALVPTTPGALRRRLGLAGALATTGLALIALSFAGLVPDVAAFFGAGACALAAGLVGASAWLRRGTIGGSLSGPRPSVVRLGVRHAAWRPGQSVSLVALVAFACFVLVAVGAFRRDLAGGSLDRKSGTGGFSLMAESVVPLMHDPKTKAGRDELALPDDPLLTDLHVARFRLRPGDEASCLTLYRPTTPRLIAPEPRFIEENRFTFSASLAETAEEHENPWRLLHRRFDDGAVPAIADQTSLTYVFHLAVGDDFVFTPGGQAAPVRLRIVGALADSALQSELIIGEPDFVRRFPHQEGYRVWLVEAPPERSAGVATLLEDRLADFGVDLIDTRERLAAYHRVENTYLSTFQALGGLGLLIGTLGLAAVLARNVLERRREMGLLAAVGFEPRHLRTIVLAEGSLLVVSGLLLGTVAALVAVWPALVGRAQAPPLGGLMLMLGAVVLTALAASGLAVRLVSTLSITEAVKGE